jgi:ABC-type uncharacterized transport system involved in gliding motility auxiliary subunit
MAHRKAQFKSTYLIFIVIMALALIFINAIASRYFVRKDLTEEKLFSVSQSAKNIFGKLSDRMEVTYYLSNKLPDQLRNLKRDTIDKFKEFEIASDGNFSWKVIAPDKDEEVKEKLKEMQVNPLRGQVIKEDEVQQLLFYSALVIKYSDKPREVINEYYEVRALEYELARKVMQLTLGDAKPKVKFFTSIEQEQPPPNAPPNMQQPSDQYGPLLQVPEINERFSIGRTMLVEGDSIDSSASCLVLAQPEQLNERQVYEVNKYLAEGGNVVALVQKRVLMPQANYMFRPINSGLNGLLGFLGLTIEDKLIGDVSHGAYSISSQQQGFTMQQQIPIPAIVTTTAEGLSQESPITHKLAGTTFPWPAPIITDDETLGKNGLSVEILAQSSKKSWLYPSVPRGLTKEIVSPRITEDDFSGGHNMAVLVTGIFPMQAGIVPQWPSDAPDTAAESAVEGPVAVESSPGRLLLISSADMLKYDYLKDRRNVLNVHLFMNAIELFSLGSDLIEIRMKPFQSRPLEETTKSQKLMYRIFNIGIVPAVVILFGLARFFWRRGERKRYLESLKLAQH